MEIRLELFCLSQPCSGSQCATQNFVKLLSHITQSSISGSELNPFIVALEEIRAGWNAFSKETEC